MGQKYHNSLDEIVQNFGSYSCYIQVRGTDIEIYNLKPIESDELKEEVEPDQDPYFRPVKSKCSCNIS